MANTIKVYRYSSANSIFFMLSLFILNTYYFYNIGLPIMQMLGLLFLIYAYNIYNIKNNVIKKPFYLMSLFILIVSFSIVVNIFLLDSIAVPTAFIGLLLCIIVFLFSYSINITNISIYNIVTKLTMILLFFWIIQFISYYVFNYRVDYFIDIVGYEQRTNLGVFGEAFFRPASLLLEPAMYANTMLLLFYFRFLYQNFKLDKINILIVISIIFTLSTYGYAAFGVLYLALLATKKKYFATFFLILFILGIMIFFIGGLESNMIIKRVLNPLSDMSGTIRVVGNIYDFSNQSLFHLLFGFGWGNAELNGFQGSSMHYLLYNIGIIGLLNFVFLMYLIVINKSYKYITILVLLLTLLNNSSVLTSFFSWAMFGFIFRINKKAIN